MQTEQRYTITAVIAWHDTEHRIPLGTATSRRKARRLGYREGKYHYPLLSTYVSADEIATALLDQAQLVCGLAATLVKARSA